MNTITAGIPHFVGRATMLWPYGGIPSLAVITSVRVIDHKPYPFFAIELFTGEEGADGEVVGLN